jgi:hypothetical protein
MGVHRHHGPPPQALKAAPRPARRYAARPSHTATNPFLAHGLTKAPLYNRFLRSGGWHPARGLEQGAAWYVAGCDRRSVASTSSSAQLAALPPPARRHTAHMSQNRVRFVGKLRLPSKRRFTVTVMRKHGQRFTAADHATPVKARRREHSTARTTRNPHPSQPVARAAIAPKNGWLARLPGRRSPMTGARPPRTRGRPVLRAGRFGACRWLRRELGRTAVRTAR